MTELSLLRINVAPPVWRSLLTSISITIYCMSKAFHRQSVAESYEALANHFPFLPSTQASELKVLMDTKDTPKAPTVQKAAKGEKGDGGEPGPRGLSGADVSVTKGILEAYSKNKKSLINTPSKIRASPDGALHFDVY